MNIRCLCRQSKSDSPTDLIQCIQCGICQHKICMLGSVSAHDIDAEILYQCERCDPNAPAHQALTTTQARSAIQKRGQLEAQILNHYAQFMWRQYCILCQGLVIRKVEIPNYIFFATMLMGGEPVFPESINFLESWREGLRTVLTKYDDDGLQAFHETLEGQGWAVQPSLHHLKTEVARLSNEEEIRSDGGELGVLAEMLRLQKIGDMWKGL